MNAPALETLAGNVSGEIITEHNECPGHDDQSTATLAFSVTAADGRTFPASYTARPMETAFPALREGDPITLYGNADPTGYFEVSHYRHNPLRQE